MEKAHTKANAAIIVIGNEILSGRTQDINVSFLSKWLNEIGIRVEEVRIIEDKEKSIVDCIKEIKNKFKYVFTTGGIGPTHDDITSESIANAFNQKYTINSEAFKILENYYPYGEFNKGRQRMAMMPEGANLIPNPLTAAPGFYFKNIYVLPGVPVIMKQMINYVLQNIEKGEAKKIVTINTNLYESTIAEELALIQKNNPECSIGSYPYFNYTEKTGGVNIVVSSWTLEKIDHIINEIIKMISLMGGKSSIV